jgi:hypothetical protein
VSSQLGQKAPSSNIREKMVTDRHNIEGLNLRSLMSGHGELIIWPKEHESCLCQSVPSWRAKMLIEGAPGGKTEIC